jgi:hypothetical protein
MRPTWLFETDVFGESAEPLKAEIRRQGMACYTLRQQLLTGPSSVLLGGRRLPDDECVLCFGSFPFVHSILSRHRWVPVGWCRTENLACACYYAYFKRYLLNQRYTILPGVEAIRQRDTLFAAFGVNGEVFVRPSGCEKLFTGRRIARDAFVDALAPARYDPTTLVVVAETRDISREWRLVVADDSVIAASQYYVGGRIEVAPGCPDAVLAVAQRMLAEVAWRPDEFFMLDLCEAEGRLFLLEINSFSCSALYQCDPKAVVSIASQRASRAWEKRGESQVTEPSP